MALKSTKDGERKKMENLSAALVGKRWTIEWLPDGGELGYTSADGKICIAYESERFMEDLSDREREAFRLGVFGHEILHKAFTDFRYMSDTLSKLEPSEQSVAQTLYNLVEDPAIENQAPMLYNGELLECLRFTIRELSRKSPSISESPSAFVQLLNALVYFGDVGIIKGDFTYPEAYEAFSSMAEEFYNTIEEKDSKKRLDMAVKWMNDLRPLWQHDAENGELENNLESFEESSGISSPGAGDGMVPPDDSEDGDGEKQDSKTGQSSGSSDSSSNDSDDSNGDSDEDGEDGDGENGGSAFGNKKQNSSEEEGAKERQRRIIRAVMKEAGDEKEDAEEATTDEAGEGSGDKKDSSKMDSFNKSNQSKQDAFDKKESISKEVSDKIHGDIVELGNQAVRELAREAKLRDLNFQFIEGHEKDDIRCKNIRMSEDAEAYLSKYRDELQKYGRDISVLANSLKKLLNQDNDSMSRVTSGKINIKRAVQGQTVKIFDKRRDRKYLDDVSVMLLIDESGSMAGLKSEIAKRTGIILSEAFSRIGISCYVMGFTADTGGADVVHHHYVTWNNSDTERASLCKMKPGGNNCDSYSISYATKVLRQRNAVHKILFVISDGRPNCSTYKGQEDGLNKTAAAIAGAMRIASVIGIGIACRGVPELKKMYRGKFIDIREAENLLPQICQHLKKIMCSY